MNLFIFIHILIVKLTVIKIRLRCNQASRINWQTVLEMRRKPIHSLIVGRPCEQHL